MELSTEPGQKNDLPNPTLVSAMDMLRGRGHLRTSAADKKKGEMWK